MILHYRLLSEYYTEECLHNYAYKNTAADTFYRSVYSQLD